MHNASPLNLRSPTRPRTLTVRYTSTDSTNLRAAALARLNPGQPLVVSAVTQTAGRGRKSREWQSPEGGAWFSVVLPMPDNVEAAQAAPLIAGMAIHDTLCDLLPHAAAQQLRIKWPNDLLLNNCKIVGILCEQFLGDRPFIVVGVGINANFKPEALDEHQLRRPATSLAEHLQQPVAVDRLIDHAAGRLIRQFADLSQRGLDEELRNALRERLAWVGESVRIRHHHVELIGKLIGIDQAGRLSLATAHGPRSFVAGEIELLYSSAPQPSVLT